MLKNIFLICFLFVFVGCTQNNIPKPKAYPRVYLPKKAYQEFLSDCSYRFEYPIYGEIQKKDSFGQKKLSSDLCWFDLYFPEFDSRIHFSYKYFTQEQELIQLLEENYRMTSKHMRKASYIKDSIFETPDKKVMLFNVGGDAASQRQFIITDGKNKYIRGALYFNVTPNSDSLRPIVAFLDEDLKHLIQTFRF
ncbi:MAG: hypothetical protein MUE53_00575 [Chitinophagales bacterium]|jgi:gliding motility-associated lipoprotein GldD|nr:hypothetical protein [Chitinophagales bacterium]